MVADDLSTQRDGSLSTIVSAVCLSIFLRCWSSSLETFRFSPKSVEYTDDWQHCVRIYAIHTDNWKTMHIWKIWGSNADHFVVEVSLVRFLLINVSLLSEISSTRSFINFLIKVSKRARMDMCFAATFKYNLWIFDPRMYLDHTNRFMLTIMIFNA